MFYGDGKRLHKNAECWCRSCWWWLWYLQENPGIQLISPTTATFTSEKKKAGWRYFTPFFLQTLAIAMDRAILNTGRWLVDRVNCWFWCRCRTSGHSLWVGCRSYIINIDQCIISWPLGGLLVRLPFIWRLSLRNRWKDVRVDDDGGDADGDEDCGPTTEWEKLVRWYNGDGNGWVLGQAALHHSSLRSRWKGICFNDDGGDGYCNLHHCHHH